MTNPKYIYYKNNILEVNEDLKDAFFPRIHPNDFKNTILGNNVKITQVGEYGAIILKRNQKLSTLENFPKEIRESIKNSNNKGLEYDAQSVIKIPGLENAEPLRDFYLIIPFLISKE